jgi:hypothetical protein
MSTTNWDEAKYGPREEHSFLTDETKLDGWSVGDRFKMFEDEGEEGPFEGETGTIVAIGDHPGGMFNAPGKFYLADMDGYEELMSISMYKLDEEF